MSSSAFCSPLATSHSSSTAFPRVLRPRKLDTGADLYDYALRVLMRRAHSVHEMKNQALAPAPTLNSSPKFVWRASKNPASSTIPATARQFTRTHAEVRKQGKFVSRVPSRPWRPRSPY